MRAGRVKARADATFPANLGARTPRVPKLRIVGLVGQPATESVWLLLERLAAPANSKGKALQW